MLRVLLILLGFCSNLAGCQIMPIHSATAPVPEHTIVLFREVEPKRDEIKQAVLGRIPLGTPIEQAQAVLEAQGFVCRPYSRLSQAFNPNELLSTGIALPPEVNKRLSKEHKNSPVYCRVTLPELQDWHLMSCVVLVVLIPDEARLVRDIEVGTASKHHPHAYFFTSKKPELREPTGLPVETARVRMEAAGFRSKVVAAEARDKDSRPYVLCEVYDENPLGGLIIRVKLFTDEAGVVRETRVVEGEELFDAERCMLPHGDEGPIESACRYALFPVRAGCRYTLFAIALGMAITAMPYGLH